MIARALRVEIERSASLLRLRHPFVSGADSRTRLASEPDGLAALLVRAARGSAPEHLAHRAYLLHLAAENGPAFVGALEGRCGVSRDTLSFVSGAREECRDRMEQALDAIDVLVDDPAQLPGLREDLRALIAQVESSFEGAARAGRSDDLRVSAA